jgi:dTDP-glucose pyrophosphorylase
VSSAVREAGGAAGSVSRLVVLAAGRGTRMQAADEVPLAADQRAAADRGLKALVPFRGAPFLAYVLDTAAAAGIAEACIVVAPGDDPVRRHFAATPARRLKLSFAVQEEPRGSAHALLAAERFAGTGEFLLVNGDNHYPAAALQALRALDGPGLIGFSGDGLRRGGMEAARLAAFALVETGPDCMLRRIVEKPDPGLLRGLPGGGVYSMTCWRFGPRIFDACRAVAPSARGELELPDAVSHAMAACGEAFRVVPMDAAVLDLSTRRDIPVVEAALAGRSPRP